MSLASIIGEGVRGLSATVAGALGKPQRRTHLDIVEFNAYLDDIRAVFEYLQQYDAFTGPEVNANLRSICDLLEPTGHQVWQWRVREQEVQIDPELEEKYAPFLGSVKGWEIDLPKDRKFDSIAGFLSDPPKATHLRLSEFYRLVTDVKEAFEYIRENGQFIGPEVDKALGQAAELLESINQQIYEWQVSGPLPKPNAVPLPDAPDPSPLNRKYVSPVLRKFVP